MQLINFINNITGKFENMVRFSIFVPKFLCYQIISHMRVVNENSLYLKSVRFRTLFDINVHTIRFCLGLI